MRRETPAIARLEKAHSAALTIAASSPASSPLGIDTLRGAGPGWSARDRFGARRPAARSRRLGMRTVTCYRAAASGATAGPHPRPPLHEMERGRLWLV